MSDLISRQAAKSKAVYSPERHEKVVPVAELDWLPSVEPERKKGKWENTIYNRTAMVKCSICGGLDLCHADFCHWCGADMREVQDDRT